MKETLLLACGILAAMGIIKIIVGTVGLIIEKSKER